MMQLDPVSHGQALTAQLLTANAQPSMGPIRTFVQPQQQSRSYNAMDEVQKQLAFNRDFYKQRDAQTAAIDLEQASQRNRMLLEGQRQRNALAVLTQGDKTALARLTAKTKSDDAIARANRTSADTRSANEITSANLRSTNAINAAAELEKTRNQNSIDRAEDERIAKIADGHAAEAIRTANNQQQMMMEIEQQEKLFERQLKKSTTAEKEVYDRNKANNAGLRQMNTEAYMEIKRWNNGGRDEFIEQRTRDNASMLYDGKHYNSLTLKEKGQVKVAVNAEVSMREQQNSASLATIRQNGAGVDIVHTEEEEVDNRIKDLEAQIKELEGAP